MCLSGVGERYGGFSAEVLRAGVGTRGIELVVVVIVMGEKDRICMFVGC